MSNIAPSAMDASPKSARETFKVIHAILAFVAGFTAILVFHQGVRAILLALGAASATPYDLDRAVVASVPRVLARAFWGGVWGIVLVLLSARVARQPHYAFWLFALIFGALLPSLFAWFVLAPIKGQALAAGGDPSRIGVALVANGAWGLGTAALYRVMQRVVFR